MVQFRLIVKIFSLILAITKFNCTANIVKETKCKELEVKSKPVDYKYLIEHEISEVCEQFNKEILKLDLRYTGNRTDPGEYSHSGMGWNGGICRTFLK